MDRREILKNILAAVVGGVALSATTATAAKALGWDKYSVLVRKQKDIIALDKLMKDKSGTSRSGRISGYSEMMSPKIDDLLGFSMDNFTGDVTSPEAYEACAQIFKGREFCNTLDVDALKQILEVVIPIAVARNLLAYYRITFDPHGMVNWDRFSDRYQDLILAA